MSSTIDAGTNYLKAAKRKMPDKKVDAGINAKYQKKIFTFLDSLIGLC
jgi:hypothetical protein